jgi:hypothetical protein
MFSSLKRKFLFLFFNIAGPSFLPVQYPTWLPEIAETMIIGTASQIGKSKVVLSAMPRMNIRESPGRNEPKIVAVSINRISADPKTANVPKDSIMACGSSN